MQDWIEDRVVELIYTATRHGSAACPWAMTVTAIRLGPGQAGDAPRAELDGAFFHLYGIDSR